MKTHIFKQIWIDPDGNPNESGEYGTDIGECHWSLFSSKWTQYDEIVEPSWYMIPITEGMKEKEIRINELAVIRQLLCDNHVTVAWFSKAREVFKMRTKLLESEIKKNKQ